MLFSPRLLNPGGLLAAASCTVYVPMQPVMPLVRQRGQLEAGASLQPNTRLEATIAYSPLAHCVVAGAGTVAFRLGQQQYLITRQGEASLGGYWHLGPHWLLNTLAGGGYAYTDRQFSIFGLEHYTGTYSKVFGQLGVACLTSWAAFSFSYRLAQVRYQQVQQGTRPLAAFQTHRHEVLLAYRIYFDSAARW